MKAYDLARAEARHDRHLKRKFGISLDDYRRMAAEQDHKCLTCGRPCVLNSFGSGRGTRLSFVVDHCHETGLVRGLLCHCCNTVLGLAQESPDLLLALVDYLDHSRAQRSA
jgi:hypothetical protein